MINNTTKQTTRQPLNQHPNPPQDIWQVWQISKNPLRASGLVELLPGRRPVSDWRLISGSHKTKLGAGHLQSGAYSSSGQCTVCSTVCSLQCTEHCAVCSVQFSVQLQCAVQCAVCSVQFSLQFAVCSTLCSMVCLNLKERF